MFPLVLVGGIAAVAILLLRKKDEEVAPVQTKPAVDLTKLGIVGSIVGGVIALIDHFVSTAHLRANEWVQSVQNPFGTALGKIADANAEDVRTGTATVQSVTYAKQQMNLMWEKYQKTAETWAAQGPDYRLVINQSYNTLQPLIDQLNRDMDKNIADIQARLVGG